MDQQFEKEEIKREAQLNTIDFEHPYRNIDAIIPVKGIQQFAEDLANKVDISDDDYVLLWRCCVRYCNGFTRRICKGFYTKEELNNEIFIIMNYIIRLKKTKWKDGYFLVTVLLSYRNKHNRIYGKKAPIRAYKDDYYRINHEQVYPVMMDEEFMEEDHLDKALQYVQNTYEPLLYEIFKHRLVDQLDNAKISRRLGLSKRSFDILLDQFNQVILTDRFLYKHFIRCSE